MKISTLKKVRAPGRIEFHKGLECEREACCSRLVAGRGEQKDAEGDGLKKTPFGRRAPLTLRERLPDEVADRQTGADSDGGSVHGSNLLKVQFSTALLPQRLSVSCDSDNTTNIAYMGLEVKPNRKSPYFKAFSGFLYCIKRIKKFSSPKMRNREFVFTPKIEYKLAAERSEANQNSLTFPTWCPRQESNLDLSLRRATLDPLSYGDKSHILI